jgi:acyl-CoA reductase-like NAD-dependent aldehyde dehydrogenase
MWNSGRLASMIPTVSPRPTPSFASPPATASTRASSSDQVSDTLSSGVRTATISGWLAAVRLSASVSVGASTARPRAAVIVLLSMFPSKVGWPVRPNATAAFAQRPSVRSLGPRPSARPEMERQAAVHAFGPDCGGANPLGCGLWRCQLPGGPPPGKLVSMTTLTESAATAAYGLFIDGRWRPTEHSYERRNPARPAEVVGRFASAAPEDVDVAFRAARAAAPAWRALGGIARGEILHRAAAALDARREEVARALTVEEGKAIRDARAEVARGAAILRYFAGECDQPEGEVYASATPGTLLYTAREPLGVVAAITPWNFPVAIPVWKIAPALAFGNTVVWKPGEIVPLCAVKLAEVFADAGLPVGVLNLLTGSSASGLGRVLTGHPEVDAITFTGSNRVGRAIRQAAADRGVKVQLELGGKNPAVVLADADLDRAVELTVRGAMFSTGQRCTATSRSIVVEDVFDAFVERLLVRVEGLRVGDPADDTVDLGPLASADQHRSVLDYLDVARGEGLVAACGGTAGAPEDGYFVDPTVYVDVPPNARIAREEIFGPVLAVIRARDAVHALALANDTEYGLAASVFTRDLAAALDFARRAAAGVVHVNGETAGAEPHVPFGGMKASSSHSREQGRAAREFFTDIKTIYVEAA